MLPVARPDKNSCRKSLIEGQSRTREGLVAALSRASPLLGRRQRRQRRDDLLLAVLDPDQKTLAVDIAVLVERDVHQYAWILRCRNLRAVQRFGQGLRVELADLLGHRLHDVDADVALHPVVVALVLKFLLELLIERLDARFGRIDRQADMAEHAVGRLAGELDRLLADGSRLADDRLGVALLPQ